MAKREKEKMGMSFTSSESSLAKEYIWQGRGHKCDDHGRGCGTTGLRHGREAGEEKRAGGVGP